MMTKKDKKEGEEEEKRKKRRKEKSIKIFFEETFLFPKDRWHWLRAMGSSTTLMTVMIMVKMGITIKISPMVRKLPCEPIHFELKIGTIY